MPDKAPVSVRTAAPADAGSIADVQSSAWQDNGWPPAPDAVGIWFDALGAPPDPQCVALVALEGSEVVGVLASGPAADEDTDRDWREISELAVHPDRRRRGHGSRLMSAWAELTREAGGRAGCVWIPAASEPLRAWLQESGWGTDGAWRKVAVDDDANAMTWVRMVTSLDPDEGAQG